jgi:hypothetical protein
MQHNGLAGIHIEGHIKIFDPENNEIFINKRNAIHYENFSIALANNVANKGINFIDKMAFGNGGSRVDPTGIITYLTPNTTGVNATLYSYPTIYEKMLDTSSIQILHTPGNNYTDVLISCLLDYTDANQQAFDNENNSNGPFIFDELGLVDSTGNLLTHVIFHPVQKSLNRLIQIDYTVRIQTLSGV